MTQPLLSLVNRCRLGRFAMAAARPRTEPVRGWTTGFGTDAETRRLTTRREKWAALSQPADILWLEGIRLTLYPGNELSRVIFLTGRYEPNEFHWLAQILKPGMTVVDAGANMGVYSLYIARRVGADGTVLAFEPSPREFARLEHHVRLNRLDNVRCVRAALHDHDGEAPMQIASEWNAGHNTLGAFGYEQTELAATETVTLQRLDDLLTTLGIGRVDLIKLDIEGAELHALRGAADCLARDRPTLLLEIAEESLRAQGASGVVLRTWLEDRGYRLYAFDGEGGLEPVMPEHLRVNANFVALAD